MARRFQSNFAFPGSLFGTVAFCAINLTMPVRFHSQFFSPELSAVALKLPLGTSDRSIFQVQFLIETLIEFALEYRLFVNISKKHEVERKTYRTCPQFLQHREL